MSPTLKDMLRQPDDLDLFVTGPHYEWLEKPELNQLPSMRALFHMIRAVMMRYKHPRVGRFSPSSMGKCSRRVVFGWAGAPEAPPSPELEEIFNHGTKAHIWWQLEGLTMGWMKEAEVWVEDKDLMTGGSMDAVLADDSIFELKSGAPTVYRRVVSDAREPTFDNRFQLETYMMLSGRDYASLVYEDRAYGNFHEFRVGRDAKMEREVLRRLNSYKRYVEDDVLPPQLEMCEMRTGTVFKECPFRDICHVPKTVSDAQRLAPPKDETVNQEDWAEELFAWMAEMEAKAK